MSDPFTLMVLECGKNTVSTEQYRLKSHQPLVAGWFRMLHCSYTLPSFPSGKGLPFPLPPPQDPRPWVARGLFWQSRCSCFLHRFSMPFWVDLACGFPPNLPPQLDQNPRKIDAKMPSILDSVLLIDFWSVLALNLDSLDLKYRCFHSGKYYFC